MHLVLNGEKREDSGAVMVEGGGRHRGMGGAEVGDGGKSVL